MLAMKAPLARDPNPRRALKPRGRALRNRRESLRLPSPSMLMPTALHTCWIVDGLRIATTDRWR
jgi:hypothetical protein